jgi:hypothetical protein
MSQLKPEQMGPPLAGGGEHTCPQLPQLFGSADSLRHTPAPQQNAWAFGQLVFWNVPVASQLSVVRMSAHWRAPGVHMPVHAPAMHA